jgi:hypothetical protein
MDAATIELMKQAGMTTEQIAAAIMKSTAAPAVSTNPQIAALREAKQGSDRSDRLAHPKGAPWSVGQPGAFDGDFAITVSTYQFKTTKKGNLYEIVFTIDESTHSLVPVGSRRSHEIWQNNPAGESEGTRVMQVFSDCAGHQGPWSDEFYLAVTGETQAAKGLRFHLSVRTRALKNSAGCFTDHKYTPIKPGQVLGLSPGTIATVAPAPAPVAAPAASPIPPSWPKNNDLRYPGATDAQWAVHMAS